MLIDIESFRFKLAKELGKSLVEIDDMSYSEFYQWYKYSERELFTSDRLEVMIAQLTAVTINIAKTKSKDKKLTSSLDFLISIDEETKEFHRKQAKENDLFNMMRGFKK